MSKKIEYKLTKKQTLAYQLLTNSENLSVLYGGAKGGGKSYFFCVWVILWCKHLKELFGLKYDAKTPPIPVGFIGRKQGVDFRRTTLETFKKVIPSELYRIREQDQEIILFDCMKVYFGGLDDQQRINKFNSAEFAFIGVDQAEETERTDVDVLQGALRLRYNNITPPYKQLYTANPSDCWLKEEFIDNKVEGKYFIPALHTDNPHLPDSYADTLRSAFRYNKALLAAYLEGDWYSLQSENSLVSNKMLAELKEIRLYPKDTKRIIVCDPSLGGDECVIKFMENYEVKDMLILHERDTMKIAGSMVVMGERARCSNYAIDVIGIGQGIADRVREIKPKANVIYINSASQASDPEKFYNLRAEMAWIFMGKVIDRKIPYPKDEETRSQLLSYRFKVVNSNGRIQLEAKDKIKERIGRSPDRGDTFIMGIWALDQTEPVKEKDAWREDSYSTREVGIGAASAMSA